jgi:hypothetical protein
LEAPEIQPAEGMPDWLMGMAPPAGDQPAAQSSSGDLSSWLNSLETTSQPETPPPGEPLPAPTSGLVPSSAVQPERDNLDWLSTFTGGPSAAPESSADLPVAGTPAPSQPIQPEGELPDWLKDFNLEGQQTTADQPASPTPLAQAASESPDWLSAFASAGAAEESAPTSPFEAVPGAEGDALPAEDIPEWLKPIAAQQELPPAKAPLEPVSSGSVSPFNQDALPDWMKEGPFTGEPAPARLVDRSPEQLAAGPTHPFAGDEMPDWLNKSETEPDLALAAGESGAEILEQAQLPSWVQAMRPLESVTPGAAPLADAQRVEKSGPLAGLRGVLPGEDLVAAYHKPPVYTAKLHVSDKQQSHAALLEGLLGSETRPQEIPAEPTQAPQYFVRLATALALIALLLIVLLSGLRPLVPASLSMVDAQVSALNKLVNELPVNAPVLVAVEYEAGLQGELSVVALPVLRHLMARQTRLVLISTNPIGPLLGEDLLSRANLNQLTFKPGLQQANLGYLLGGSTALKQLASPAGAGLPQPLVKAIPVPWSTAGSADWKANKALAGLNQMADFKLILVLTDNPETGRAWVEQVQPEINNRVPLVVISSAQAAPLLRPYQASGQVQALISGLSGGAAYEQVRQNPGEGTAYWNAYQAGILAAVLFILMGGVVSLISNLTHRKSSAKK